MSAAAIAPRPRYTVHTRPLARTPASLLGTMQVADHSGERKKRRRHDHGHGHGHDHRSEKSSHRDEKKRCDEEDDGPRHHKSHRKKHRHHKDKHGHRHRHEPAEVSAAKGEADLFTAFVQAHPTSRGELRSLLALLDDGQAVILDQIADSAVRTRLRCALEALGVRPDTLPDGSLVFAAADSSRLSQEHAELLREDMEVGGKHMNGSGSSIVAQDSTAEPAAAASHSSTAVLPKRVYGVSLPPATEMARPDIGPVHYDEEEEDLSSASSQVGPSLPASDGAAASECGGHRWWQREQAAPRPAAAVEDAGPVEHSVARDGWMVSVPAGGLPTDQARQFLRRGREPVGEGSAAWLETPADHQRKAAVEQADDPSQPKTLAEAVAIASANAGKHTRASFGSHQAPFGEDRVAQPAAKSLLEVHAGIKRDERKIRSGKAEWEGNHPWRPWNRETDLDVRAANPKGTETILNHVSHLANLVDERACHLLFLCSG